MLRFFYTRRTEARLSSLEGVLGEFLSTHLQLKSPTLLDMNPLRIETTDGDVNWKRCDTINHPMGGHYVAQFRGGVCHLPVQTPTLYNT